jgi:hypothetical protein
VTVVAVIVGLLLVVYPLFIAVVLLVEELADPVGVWPFPLLAGLLGLPTLAVLAIYRRQRSRGWTGGRLLRRVSLMSVPVGLILAAALATLDGPL